MTYNVFGGTLNPALLLLLHQTDTGSTHSAGARVLEQGGHGERVGGPGPEPLWRGAKPPEDESFLAHGCATDRANLYLQYFQQSITIR